MENVALLSENKDYQTQVQSQGHSGIKQQSPPNSNGHGSYRQSEDPKTTSPTLSEDHAFTSTTQPYQTSPVLSENQPILARVQQPGLVPSGVIGAPGGTPGGNSRPSSPLHGYQPVQQPFYSPYQSNQPLQTQDRQEYRVDPYRSVYSQQQYQMQQMQYQGSPYHEPPGSMGYPMRALPSHESHLALTASHQSHSHSGTTPASSDFGGGRSDRYQDIEDGRQSSTMQHQYSMTDSSADADRQIKKGEEGDEDSEIMQSLSGSKNGYTKSNKKKNRSASGENSEEEGQERGALRQRDGKRCWCCSRRLCMWMKIDQTKIGNNKDMPSSFVIKPKNMNQVISVQMMMDYTSLKIDTNADGTLQTLIAACKPIDTSTGAIPRGINLTFGGKMYIWGLSWIWKPQFSFNVESVPCPVNARDPDSMLPPSNGGGSQASTTSSSQPSNTSAGTSASQSSTASGSARATSSTPAATRTA
ncbi:hypothetical protein BGZ76_002985 [Entomortierella beljakovae]|nr:hypothetical protein BGZ76_002985 [Entomortierella beljakovae]